MKNDDFIICPSCGEPMRRDQRNCLKCGQLNYENPNNTYMKKYDTNTNNNTSGPYVIGQGMVTGAKHQGKAIREMIADKAGNFSLCVTLNILFYLGGLVLLFLIAFICKGDLLDTLLDKSFALFSIFYSLVFIEVYALELLFMKANQTWWKALIPIYNVYVFNEITMGSGWFSLLLLIPGVGLISLFISYYKLGVVYGKNPWLTLLFGFIMIPVIGFDSTTNYKGVRYINTVRGKDPMEVLYKWNKRVLSCAYIFILAGILSLSYSNREWFVHKFNQILTGSFIRDANLIVQDAKKSIENDQYVCSNGLPLTAQNIYYIEFDNAGAYFNSKKVSDSSLSHEFYHGYIKVVDGAKYYIAVDDTKYGMLEVEESKIKKSYAKKDVFVKIPEGVITCSKINS